MFGETSLLFIYFEACHYNSSFSTKIPLNTYEHSLGPAADVYEDVYFISLSLTRGPHMSSSSSPSPHLSPSRRGHGEQQQQHAGSPRAAAAARIAEVVGGRRVHAGLGVPVTEEGRRVAEEEERSTANSLVGPMTPGRVLVAAVAAQSGTWRRQRDSVRMEGGALGAD